MKHINGETYYISLGYVENEQQEQTITPNIIKNLIMDSKNGTVYIDDSDKENIITLPLMKVNQIQKSNSVFSFRFLLLPYKTKWVNKSDNDNSLIKFNIIGLFAAKKENNIETIRLVQFFKCDTRTYTTYNHEPSTTILIEVEESKILGE